MRININEILKEKNKSLYWLAKEIDVTYPTIHKLAMNKTESIKFDILERICNTLECSVCDILIVED